MIAESGKIGDNIERLDFIENKFKKGIIMDFIIDPMGKVMFVVKWEGSKYITTVYPEKVDKI